MIKKTKFETSTGNIFADLGLENAEELQARAQIGFHVVELLKTKDMKQKEIAAVLEIKQAEASHLFNGHFSHFSVDMLLDFLKKMDQEKGRNKFSKLTDNLSQKRRKCIEDKKDALRKEMMGFLIMKAAADNF